MDPIRPLAGLTVVLVIGTGVVTGLQLNDAPDRLRSSAAPAPALTSPTAASNASPNTPQQGLPIDHGVPAPATGVTPPLQPPAQLAQVRAAQRHAASFARLRRQAVLLCRRWGFPQARCDNAPR